MPKIDNSRDSNEKNLFLQISNCQHDGWEEKNDGCFSFYCSHHYKKERLRALRSLVNEQLWRNLKKIQQLMTKNGQRFAIFQPKWFQGKENTTIR